MCCNNRLYQEMLMMVGIKDKGCISYCRMLMDLLSTRTFLTVLMLITPINLILPKGHPYGIYRNYLVRFADDLLVEKVSSKSR